MNSQREIKFRVWNKIDKIMLSPENQADLVLTLSGGLFSRFDKEFENRNNYIIQQFTGLKDKNVKEVFEGDVIQYEIGDSLTQIIWSEEDSAFITKSRHGGGFINPLRMLNYKIVGNIFENPNLLV